MTMMRKLFRPAAGQRHAAYVAAYVNGSTIYRGDLVAWDTTAPASQGSSGVLAGQTLGANDFLFVAAPPTTCGIQAGIVEGNYVSDRVQATALTNDTVIVIQTWGVHDNVWCDATGAAGSNLTVAATTGESTLVAAWAKTVTNIADAALVGVVLTASATTHTRGTVATEEGCCAFVRCAF